MSVRAASSGWAVGGGVTARGHAFVFSERFDGSSWKVVKAGGMAEALGVAAVGPNLAFTGSLSAYLWYRAARGAGAQPSLKTSSVLGLALVPLTIAAALGMLALVDASAF